MGTPVGNVTPERFDDDFVITANHCAVLGCDSPIAGTDEQIMARNDDACGWMSNHIISIVWIE
jgi:hypothetical protein